MDNLNYCIDCRRISTPADECTYCNSKNFKELAKNAPVNVIGSKLKGRVLNTKEGKVQLLVVGEGNVKSIREFEPTNIRKIL